MAEWRWLRRLCAARKLLHLARRNRAFGSGTGPLVDIKVGPRPRSGAGVLTISSTGTSAPGSSYFVTARQKATARARTRQEIYARNTAWIQRDRARNGWRMMIVWPRRIKMAVIISLSQWSPSAVRSPEWDIYRNDRPSVIEPRRA